MLPTSMSLRCSPSEVALLIARIVAADATAYAMPMIASCGMRARRLRMVENRTAPRKVKARLTQYTAGAVRIAVRDRQEQRDGGAEGRDLRERQVDEDDPALDDMHAQIGVNAGDDEARGKRQREEAQNGGVNLHGGLSRFRRAWRRRRCNAFTSRLMS